MIPLLSMVALLQAAPSEPIKASELKVLVGPQAPRYPDPAGGPGEDRGALKMRQAARRGNVPAVEVPAGTRVISDRTNGYAGWKAYQVQVPGKGSVSARLRSDHEAWFRVTTTNQWGRMEEGMLQNRIYRGNPSASYNNPKDAPNTIFFVVDTTEATPMSEPYTLEITWK